MVRLLVKHLEKHSNASYYCGGYGYCVASMLTVVQSCDDLQLYIEYLAVVTRKGFGAAIAESLLLGCEHLGWVALHDTLCAMLQHNVNKPLKECVSFMVKFCQAEGAPSVFSDQQQLRTCTELCQRLEVSLALLLLTFDHSACLGHHKRLGTANTLRDIPGVHTMQPS